MTAGGLDGRVAGTSPYNTGVGGGLHLFINLNTPLFLFVFELCTKNYGVSLKFAMFPSSHPAIHPTHPSGSKSSVQLSRAAGMSPRVSPGVAPVQWD